MRKVEYLSAPFAAGTATAILESVARRPACGLVSLFQLHPVAVSPFVHVVPSPFLVVVAAAPWPRCHVDPVLVPAPCTHSGTKNKENWVRIK